jgi:hypothetical protein
VCTKSGATSKIIYFIQMVKFVFFFLFSCVNPTVVSSNDVISKAPKFGTFSAKFLKCNSWYLSFSLSLSLSGAPPSSSGPDRRRCSVQPWDLCKADCSARVVDSQYTASRSLFLPSSSTSTTTASRSLSPPFSLCLCLCQPDLRLCRLWNPIPLTEIFLLGRRPPPCWSYSPVRSCPFMCLYDSYMSHYQEVKVWKFVRKLIKTHTDPDTLRKSTKTVVYKEVFDYVNTWCIM